MRAVAGRTPRFSVLTAVYDPPVEILQECVDSVLGQSFPDWEWVLVDDGSHDPQVLDLLREVAAHPRVRLLTRPVNGGISAASADGLQACTGELVALLDHDDRLVPDALQVMDAYLVAGVDLAYSDEEIIDEQGQVVSVVSKPGWSPTRLRAHNYANHLTVVRASTAAAAGGFRAGFDGSQDHDLLLRVAEVATAAIHVPHVLYQWRMAPASVLTRGLSSKPEAWENGRRAVAEHCSRVGLGVQVGRLHVPGIADWYDVVPSPARWPSVGLVATAGRPGRRCGDAFPERWVQEWTSQLRELAACAVLVVDDDVAQDQARVLSERFAAAGVPLELVVASSPSSRSARLQQAALRCDVEVLLLASVDVLPDSEQLVRRLVGGALEPDAGLVAAQVHGRGDVIRHAGYSLVGGAVRHFLAGLPSRTTAYNGAALVPGERSAVSAAAAAVRKDVYASVGGLSATIGSALADVDLGLKLRREGRRNVCLESRVRLAGTSATADLPDPVEHHEDMAALRRRWAAQLADDPYVNPRVRSAAWVSGVAPAVMAG